LVIRVSSSWAEMVIEKEQMNSNMQKQWIISL